MPDLVGVTVCQQHGIPLAVSQPAKDTSECNVNTPMISLQEDLPLIETP